MSQLTLMGGDPPEKKNSAPGPVEPTKPYSKPGTSREAAHSVTRGQAVAQRQKILDYLGVRGTDGATREEIEEDTDLSGNTVRPRLVELIRAGKVVETKVTRPTRSGRAASVLKAASPA